MVDNKETTEEVQGNETQQNPENQDNEQQTQQETTETPETKVVPPDEKTVRSALAGDENFNLEELNIEEPNTENQQKEESTDNQEEQKVEETEVTDNQNSEFKYNPVWDKIKQEYEEQVGEGTFKMPEDITPETEYEQLIGFLQKNLEPDYSDMPDVIKEQIELHKEGKYDPSQYFSQNSTSRDDIINLPDRDFMFAIYKSKNGKSEQNPEGWEDGDIEEFLSKKSKIELHEMAQETRGKVQTLRQQQKEQHVQKLQKQQEEQLEQVITQKINRAKETVNRHAKTNDFFGIEFTPEEKKEFDRDFLELVKIDKKTGTNKLGEMLSDDNTLYKISGLLWKGENLKGYITELKEKTKEETARKLDPDLQQQKGSTKMAKPVDRSKLV